MGLVFRGRGAGGGDDIDQATGANQARSEHARFCRCSAVSTLGHHCRSGNGVSEIFKDCQAVRVVGLELVGAVTMTASFDAGRLGSLLRW
jgi:hypothetical protein